uniref:M6 family metalloprotease domain-containing protein n=1 Tax=Candidatus Kentrum sp. TC TaxID=2126339 RepID=A0A450YER8_9GAMM|nr:MAG: M6 family metalloprotease domain-containing protein [Candidatus Kentron sp. TC]
MSVLLGQIRKFPQGDGPDIQLRVTGDEYYAHYETPRGHTVVHDARKGKYCYAVLEVGHLVSSGIPVDQGAPGDIPRHIQEDPAVRNEIFARRYNEIPHAGNPPPSVAGKFNRSHNASSPRLLSTGGVRGLTIMLDFQDVRTSITSDQLDGLLNGDTFTAYGNDYSVKQYFHMMSSGKLEYTNRVVGPVLLSRSQLYYTRNYCMAEALDKAVNEFNLDLSEFDSNNDGVVDALNFVYAGATVYYSDPNDQNNTDRLWPHQSDMIYHGVPAYNGIQPRLYTIQSLGTVPNDMKIGTFCHETGHMICLFPDLYDYGNRGGDYVRSAGLGYYCLMSAGNHLGNGGVPAPVCAYLRDRAGWTTNEISLNAEGNFQIGHGNYGEIHKYKTGKSNEYFLIENRTKTGIDRYCPSSGLAVYHCDTRGSNEYQDGTADKHYECALIQADGRRDLETNYYNRGDSTDLFKEKPGVVLSHDTNPHSREWSGVDSGLKISNIGAPGDAIGFRVDDPQDPDEPIVDPDPPTGGGESGAITKESSPFAHIPDSNPEGVTDTIVIAKDAKITSFEVEIDITHTWIGDLEVELITPHGTTTLQEREGGSADNLRLRYSSSALAGKSTAGNWSLKVADLASADVGKLNSWKLVIGYTS